MASGQDPVSFPDYTLREMAMVIEASGLRDARVSWQNAQYAKFAYHQPNDMPEMPGEDESRRLDPDVAEEIKAIQRQVKLQADMEKGQHHGR